MSRYVRVSDSDYKITVASSGTITLDTGDEKGTVVVTGDLLVKGNTTTVQSEELKVKDNIIVVNDGDTGQGGITLGTAGLEINRGINSFYPAVRLVFDESINAFSIRTSTTGVLQALQASAIITRENTNLTLLGPNSGAAKVTVAGTTNYELNIGDDDDIPNIKWVQDFTTAYFENTPPEFIEKGNSILQIFDSEFTAETLLQLKLDGAIAAEFRNSKFEVQDVRIVDSTISSLVSNTNLTLVAPGTGDVVVDDILRLKTAAVAPSTAAVDGIKIYTGSEAQGGTGIYFVNTKSTKDELISRRKALAYSMIF